MTSRFSFPGLEEAEREFEKELEVFRREAQGGIQFLYAYLSIHATLMADKALLRRINETPLFWKTVDGALHSSAFITLGRLFDQDSDHNVDRLLALAQQNIGMFSRRQLGERKKRNSSDVEAWLSDFLGAAYEPTAADFRQARGLVDAQRRVFDRVYKPIRDKIFAHKELTDETEVTALYGITNIDEFAGIFSFLQTLYEVFWELYFNGAKPNWTRDAPKVSEILKEESTEKKRGSLQRRITLEAREALRLLDGSRNASADDVTQ